MAEHLIFQLVAALGSMGEFGGHERRGSLTWPGRSAVIGLMAAAMGIRRDGDFAALDALSVSVAVFSPGEPLRDYHTAQTVPVAAVKVPQSRPDALDRAGQKVNTVITKRDYRSGAAFGVAVTGTGLEQVRNALFQPVFTLWLGRKSCPLAAPLDPQIVEAASEEAALAHLRLPDWLANARADRLYCDDAVGNDQVEQRHDIALDRKRWHFGARAVGLRAVDIRPEVAR